MAPCGLTAPRLYHPTPLVSITLRLPLACRRSFWDQETWMYPGVLLLHPDTAASLLEYRVQRLAGGESGGPPCLYWGSLAA